MSKQHHRVQLLALGLLNDADDEGFFYADPTALFERELTRKSSESVVRMFCECPVTVAKLSHANAMIICSCIAI